MKTLFIIPCAILVDDEESQLERLFQLQHTIDSITSRFKNPEIKIYDLMGTPASVSLLSKINGFIINTTENDKDVLNIKKKAADVRLPVVGSIRPAYEKGYIKNATESLIICKIIDSIDASLYDRIYKITGRYFFNNSFNLKEHDVFGKITFKNKSRCGHGKYYTKTDYLRHCMYWSFCPSILEEVKDSFKKIHDYIIDHSNGKGIASIENGLDLFFDDDIINSIQNTGVSGRVDGQYFYID